MSYFQALTRLGDSMVLTSSMDPSCELRALRASGADNGKANRTPSAWMILPVVFALWQILFQVVLLACITFCARKWVTCA